MKNYSALHRAPLVDCLGAICGAATGGTAECWRSCWHMRWHRRGIYNGHAQKVYARRLYWAGDNALFDGCDVFLRQRPDYRRFLSRNVRKWDIGAGYSGFCDRRLPCNKRLRVADRKGILMRGFRYFGTGGQKLHATPYRRTTVVDRPIRPVSRRTRAVILALSALVVLALLLLGGIYE